MSKFDELKVYGISEKEYNAFTDFVFLGGKVPAKKIDGRNTPSTLCVSDSNLLVEGAVNRDISVVNGALKAPEVGDGVVIRALVNQRQDNVAKLEDGAENPKSISKTEFFQGEKNVSNAIDITGNVGKKSNLIAENGSVHVGGDIGKGGLVKLLSKNDIVHVEGALEEDVIIDAGETGKIILDKQSGDDCRFICDSLTIEGQETKLGSDGRIVADKSETVQKLLSEPIKPPVLLIEHKEEIPKTLAIQGDVPDGEELKARKEIKVTGNVGNASLKLTEPDDKSFIHVAGYVDGVANFYAGEKGAVVLDKLPNRGSEFICGHLYVGAIVKPKDRGTKSKKPEILRHKCNVNANGKAIIPAAIARAVAGADRVD